MPVSIEDVARKANVSISTVSRVLNRRNLVNARTRQRVERAIKQLHYRPNIFARGLMLQKSEMVGLVLPDLHGEFYSEIIRGANQEARELGYNLVISSAKDSDDTQSLLEGIQQRSFLDGVAIMVSEVTGGMQELLVDFAVPFVVLDGKVDGAMHDSVVIDQGEGARAMMRHLVNTCGMQRVFFVGGLRTNVDTIARLEAHQQVLSEAGIEHGPLDIYHLDYEYDTAYALATDNIHDWAGPNRCVFAANDEMASGIVDAAAAAGVAIPDDLGVVGFDDTRVARITRPPLTTVRVPMFRMGAEAIRLLCARVADPMCHPTAISLHPQLVIRKSCKCELDA